MLVVGVGIDLVEVDRFRAILERRGEAFVNRVFTDGERQQAGHGPLRPSRLAARWAAKEAAVKALGSGFRGGRWRDIELHRGREGAPELRLYGQYARSAQSLGVTALHVSISHTRAFATAIVIAEGSA